MSSEPVALSSRSDNANSATSSASMAITTADVQNQRPEEPQTPVGSLDVLHEFLDSWDDDDMLSGGSDAAFPLRQHTADAGMTRMAPSLSSPSHPMRHEHGQSPMATSLSTSSDFDRSRHKAVSDRLFGNKDLREAASAAAPPKKQRIPRKVEIAQLRDETILLEKQLHELCEHWKKNASPEDSSSFAVIVCAKQARWKQIAGRQKKLLVEAKRRNIALRNEYMLYRKIARQIRKVLMNRATSPTVSVSFDVSLCALSLLMYSFIRLCHSLPVP